MTVYNNGKVNAEYLNPAILDWFTLTAQHTGYLTTGLVTPIKINENDASTSTTSAYVLSRRPVRSDLANSVASVSATTQSAVEVTVLNGQKFFLSEQLFSRLYINGLCSGQCYIGLVTNNASGTSYLNDIIASLKVIRSDGTIVTLGSQTVQVDISNATVTELMRSVAWSFTCSGYVDKDDKMYLELSSTGYNSSASYITTHRLCFSPGSSETFCEVQV